MTEYIRKHIIQIISIVVLILLFFSFALKKHEQKTIESESDMSYIEGPLISSYDTIEADEVSTDEYPPELIQLLKKNPETEEFVLNYPSLKGTYSTESLTELLDQDSIPLIMQWDSRWGYYEYSGSVMGIMGCGPVCLSMVAIHLLQNPDLTPIYVADYAVENGYCVPGSGTAWDLMSSGAEALGLSATEVPLDENIVKNHLENGDPIICIMGKGIFTEDGHFIVMKGLEDDKIIINDPNSKTRSEQLWEYEDIKNQIRNMWVYHSQ